MILVWVQNICPDISLQGRLIEKKEKKGAGDWRGELGPKTAGLGGLLRLNKVGKTGSLGVDNTNRKKKKTRGGLGRATGSQRIRSWLLVTAQLCLAEN